VTYEATGHPARRIRLTGYRLWDDEHNGTADVGTTVRRKTPNGYHNPWRETAWEIHPVIKVEVLDGAAPPSQSGAASPPQSAASSASPSAVSTPTPTGTVIAIPQPTAAPFVKNPSSQPQFVTLTRPVTIQILYGQVTLQRGTKLPFVSRDSQSVTVRYMGEKYPVPISSTDLEEPSTKPQAPENHQ